MDIQYLKKGNFALISHFSYYLLAPIHNEPVFKTNLPCLITCLSNRKVAQVSTKWLLIDSLRSLFILWLCLVLLGPLISPASRWSCRMSLFSLLIIGLDRIFYPWISGYKLKRYRTFFFSQKKFPTFFGLKEPYLHVILNLGNKRYHSPPPPQ